VSKLLIGGWECEEHYPGTGWASRSAKSRFVEVDADSDGIEIREHSAGGYLGASGSTGIPANVFMWLAQAVRL
jgi:hypothetical protein